MAQERKSRTWTVIAEDGEPESETRARIEQALVDIYPLGFYGRRGVIVAPAYALDEESGEYRTVGFVFEEVFIPPVRRAADGSADDEAFADALANAEAAAAEPRPEPAAV